MNASMALGRTVRSVRQEAVYDHGTGTIFYMVHSIMLDGGLTIMLDHKAFTDGDGFPQDAVTAKVVNRKAKRRD